MTRPSRQARKTIAMFCDGGFLAHVTRSLEVGRALGHCFGHRVVFCCAGPYAHIPRDAGFEVRPVYTVDRETTMALARRLGPCNLGWWRSVCARSVASDLEAIDAVQPDAVVGDMRWSLSTSARTRHVPYISITNACWTSKFAHAIELPEGHLVGKLLGARLARAAFPALVDLMQRYYALGYTELRKHHGLPPIRTLYEAIEGDITLLADLPEFMPVVAETPPTFRYTGPLLWDADVPLPPWFSKLESGRPTIYFTMGSTGDAKFFEEAVSVFGNTEYQVLITTGGLAEIANAPRNVFIAKYAPGEALMAASDVVVSHGGNGTVYQALSRGVPIIGFPTIFDQEINMRRVGALGVGVESSRAKYTGGSLQNAVRMILDDPMYRGRCEKLAARISQMDGRRRAALHIDDFLEHNDPRQHPRTATDTLRTLATLPAAQIAIA
jgi:MGT family glycosyltransferase